MKWNNRTNNHDKGILVIRGALDALKMILVGLTIILDGLGSKSGKGLL
jgi:hypothetical protein